MPNMNKDATLWLLSENYPSGTWQARVRRKGEATTTKTFPSKSLADRQAALPYLYTVNIDWGGKPIENRDALYNDVRC